MPTAALFGQISGWGSKTLSACPRLWQTHRRGNDSMKRFIIPLALACFALPTAAAAELPKDTKEAIVKMGHVNDPKTASLFVSMHKGVPGDIDVSRDLPFGSDPAQRLDLFTSGQGAGKP